MKKTNMTQEEKVKRKIEKIITDTPRGIEEFGCPCEGCSETRKKIVDKIYEVFQEREYYGCKC